jgi:hypothetical protein
MECKKCDIKISDYRYHLGYTVCLDCSEVEAYSSHTVYPHKTGGYVQPVSKTTSENLKRLDRRSTGNTRRAKGIYTDNSWDRWLEEYYNPKPKRVVKKYKAKPVYHKTMNDIQDEILEYYNNNGYNHTRKHIQSLFIDNKISLLTKSQLVSKITTLQEIPKRLRGNF